MGSNEMRARIRTIALWAVVIGGGIVTAYWGVLSFSSSLAGILYKIAEGEVRTGLSGSALAVVQSFRSVILYAAVAWIAIMLVSLLRRRTPPGFWIAPQALRAQHSDTVPATTRGRPECLVPGRDKQ